MYKLIFFLLYILVFGKHNKNICFATEEIDTYCKEGNVTCEQNTENRIQFESPLEDEIYYHKGIRLVLHKGILNLLDQNTAFCFTLYNQNNARSFDKCINSKEEVAGFISPNHITINGIGEGKIDLAAWIKDLDRAFPIESTWVSYSFYVTFECIHKFKSVPSVYLEMEQVDLQAVSIINAPPCYEILLQGEIRNSRKISKVRANKTYDKQGEIVTVRNSDSNNGGINGGINQSMSEKLLRKYLGVNSGSRGVFGVPFYDQSFGHGDRIYLDFILNRNPNYRSIVEFGTFKGLTSLYLGMTARLRGKASFETFDIVDLRQPHVVSSWLDNMQFHSADLEKVPMDKNVVKAVMNTDLLFVDGRNKHIEAVLYASLLKVGSGLLIHDYQYENENFNVPIKKFPELERMGFKAYYEDAAILFNSCARFWVREKELETFDLRVWLINLGCVSVTHCDVAKTWKKHFGL